MGIGGNTTMGLTATSIASNRVKNGQASVQRTFQRLTRWKFRYFRLPRRTLCCAVRILALSLLLLVLVGSIFFLTIGVVSHTTYAYFQEKSASRSQEKLFGEILPLFLDIPLNRPLVRRRAGRRIVSGLYVGDVGDNKVSLELLRANLGESLAARGYALNLVIGHTTCPYGVTTGDGKGSAGETPKGHIPESLDRFDLLILGGGSVLQSELNCKFPAFAKKQILIAGSGLTQSDIEPTENVFRSRKIETIQQSQTFNSGMKLLTELSNRPNSTAFLSGGFRGTLTGELIGKVTNHEVHIPIIGDILHLAGDFYGVDESFDVYRYFNIPAHERYLAVNVADITKWSAVPQLSTSVTVQVLLEMVKHYHIILYSLTDADTSSVYRFKGMTTRVLERQGLNHRAQTPSRIHTFTQTPDIPILGCILRGAHLTLNYRPEGSYLSAAYGTPFVALLLRVEVVDLIDTLKIGKYALPALELDTKALTQTIKHILQDHTHVRTILQLYNEEVGLAYGALFDTLAGRLTTL